MPPSNPHAKTIGFIKMSQDKPAMSMEELALQLEIDLAIIGDKKAFVKRLRSALNAAYRQGLEINQS